MIRRSQVVSLVLIVVVAFGSLIATLTVGHKPRLGLDLQGGISVVLQPKKLPGGKAIPNEILDQSIEIIRSRVDALGVAEPEINRQGSAIIVQLPGVKNQDRARSIVGQTAQLRFRPVIGNPIPPDPKATPTTTKPTTTKPTSTKPTSTTSPGPKTTTTKAGAIGATTTAAPTTTTAPTSTTTVAAPGSEVATTSRDQDLYNKEVVLPELGPNGKQIARYRLGPAMATGDIIGDATAQLDQNSSSWLVSFKTTNKGSKILDQIAVANYQKRVAIVLDGVVKSAPTFNTQSFRGSGQITGTFTEKDAKDLALVLRYGALPIQLEQQNVEQVSATLGKDSLRAGVTAGLIGLVLVLLYIVSYYRALGLVVIFGLSVSAALLWSIVSYLGETSGLALSLSGATGIIVSVGVTVDSYVVYFEKLKDEVRLGRTVRSSLDRAFKSAFRTILAADISSLIGAIVLYFLTKGPVRGFAFFLGLSTFLDIIVAYYFTRPMVAVLGRNKFFTEMRGVGVARGLAAPSTPVAAGGAT